MSAAVTAARADQTKDAIKLFEAARAMNPYHRDVLYNLVAPLSRSTARIARACRSLAQLVDGRSVEPGQLPAARHRVREHQEGLRREAQGRRGEGQGVRPARQHVEGAPPS